MILFPNITVESWIKKHKSLKITSVKCKNCGEKISATIPFVSKDYIGLTSPPCQCGSSLTKAECSITKSKEEKNFWKLFV